MSGISTFKGRIISVLVSVSVSVIGITFFCLWDSLLVERLLLLVRLIRLGEVSKATRPSFYPSHCPGANDLQTRHCVCTATLVGMELFSQHLVADVDQLQEQLYL